MWNRCRLSIVSLALFIVGCTTAAEQPAAAPEPLALPAVAAADLAGDRLRVVATTSIVGDVVGQVGGEAVELLVLMGPGQDPHSYVAAPGELAAAAGAHVIFVHGWDLEEGLLSDLAHIAENRPLAPVAAGIIPRLGDEGDVDPHTWLDPQLVGQWVANIEQVLSELDPAHGPTYAANAAAYRSELAELAAQYEQELAAVPPDRRKLVTNHDSLGYLAAAFDFEVVATIIPAASTLSEPSAADLARLVAVMEEEGICTLFAEHTVNDRLATAVAAELAGCPEVRVVDLYTGALGPAGSGANSYLGLMRANLAAIVGGLS